MKRLASLLSLVLLATTASAQKVVDWNSLAEVTYAEVESESDGTTWVPEFPQAVSDLNGTKVRVSGYMIPLDFTEVQTSFLISAMPGDGCYFHMPGGPETIVYIEAPKGADFSYGTVEMEGTLELLKDDPYGLLYQIKDAKPVEK
ncbi:MAG: DUF3299 domain-containing protein [Rhodothermales bacterium]|nr:DUF3299 domain-containing protein [Rhodothermales bacterium]MBO6781136.1 DUF3299 domain-containing protein [Rhodothermales bacterium]